MFPLETLLTHPHGFGLKEATPLQRAVCRALTGEPLGQLWQRAEVRAAFGEAKPPEAQPRLATLLAAIRGAKSMIAAAKSLRSTQVANLEGLSAGEIPRVPIVSVRLDQAHATFEHLLGAVRMSHILRTLLLDEPTRDTMLVRHPSGRPVEIKLIAGSRAGATLVSRWNVDVIFDEAPRMLGQEDGVVNLADALSAVRGRILPGGQIGLFGSPWAPRGPVYDLFVSRFGRPGDDVLVMNCPGPAMNPKHFTPAFCEKLKADDPQAYTTDVLAQFADTPGSLLAASDVEACVRKFPIDMAPQGWPCTAVMDPATRANAWTFVILVSPTPGKYAVALARQWRGSTANPLRPSAVLREIAELCALYAVDTALTDQWSADALADMADVLDAGITVQPVTMTNALWHTAAERLRMLVSSHALSLPPIPAVRQDLLGMQRVFGARTQQIKLETTGDGRHCDFASAIALALTQPPDPPLELPQEPDLPPEFLRPHDPLEDAWQES